MKRFLILFLFLIGLNVNAVEKNIFVLPLSVSTVQSSNAYGFEPVCDIVANDIIHDFLLSNKITTEKLSQAKSLLTNDYEIREIVAKFRKTELIDLGKINEITKTINADKILLVVSYVEDKNNNKYDAWDILKLSSNFSLDYPYVLTTKVVLVNNVDNVALWQNSYSMPLSSKRKPFRAKKFPSAVEQYEKIHSFSKNIIAKDVVQNVTLRLYPKSIKYSTGVKKPEGNDGGIGLKYYKQRGVPVKITQPAESFDEQLLKDDSYSL